MVKIYYEQHRLPIRFPLYIAIVALARYIIIDSQSLSQFKLLEVGVTKMILTITVYIVLYSHVKFPYPDSQTSKNMMIDYD